jgi:hypothetical protein
MGATGSNSWGPLEFRMSNLTTSETAVVRRYLGTLMVLEHAVPRTSENLDTEQAAAWTHNRHEIRDRLRLLDEWRRRLCQFLAIPPGPGLGSNGITWVM